MHGAHLATLDGRLKIVWLKGGERLDGLDESVSNRVVHPVIASRKADVLESQRHHMISDCSF